MEKPPAVVIIARHGARIDAVDKEWHLTSPTPYDPPLTYGGWIQGRALGARIASLLKAREETVQNPSPAASSSTSTVNGMGDSYSEELHQRVPKKVRKHRVIIHSSPFLRCVQTSIAISAGISQFQRVEKERLAGEKLPTTEVPSSEDISPATTPLRSSTPSSVGKVAKLPDKDRVNGHAKHDNIIPKTRLRIDAYLGEWMSPDYYDQITPPPSSVMMIAGAKAELLRRGEGLQRANDFGHPLPGHFPGGWRNSSLPASPATDHEEGKFQGISSLADALPPIARPGSEDGLRGRSVRGITIRDVLSRAPSHSLEDFSEGYVPPVPSYAISPADPIPTGYVAHARDACVDVDYQWDSMRKPQNWGDGGEYGEEWSAMHKRFRSGLVHMLDWYAHETPQSPGRHHYHHHHRHHHHHQEDDTDTVIVIVTHGAGCNALIGALTNQPVLIDVAMASLTMAVRKDVLKARSIKHVSNGESNGGQEEQRRQSTDMSLLEEYDISLIASTEHLDGTSNPLSIPQLPGPALERSRSISAYRHRGDGRPLLIPASYETFKQNRPGPGLQRSATTNSSHHHHMRGASGLWGSVSHALDNNDSVLEESDNMPDFSQPESPSSSNDSRPQTAVSTRSSSSKQPQEQPKAQRGLWSGTVVAQEREPMKRRWTVGERR